MEETKKKKRVKKSPEEKFLEQHQKEIRKQEREQKRIARLHEKELKRLERENPPSEEELVRKYAKRVIMNDRYHGRVDKKKFKGIAKTESVNKNLWMDTDFFFSVVFESAQQKMEFLKKSGLIKLIEKADEAFLEGDQVQIINGIRFAKSMGVELSAESRREYPVGNLDLMPFVLDNEEL